MLFFRRKVYVDLFSFTEIRKNFVLAAVFVIFCPAFVFYNVTLDNNVFDIANGNSYLCVIDNTWLLAENSNESIKNRFVHIQRISFKLTYCRDLICRSKSRV